MSKNKNLSYAGGHITPLQHLTLRSDAPGLLPLILIHPPKTAGTNVVNVVEAVAKVSDAVSPMRFAVPRVEGVSPNRIVEGWIGGLKKAALDFAANPNICAGKNFISGHFPVGVDAYLLREISYMLLVRDPVAREISAALFDEQRGYVAAEGLMQYLGSSLDNPQARMLAGQMSGEFTDESWQQAMHNLETKVSIAAPAEKVNTVLEILAARNDWGPIALSRAQVTNSSATIELTPQLRAMLEAKHAYDVKLVHLVSERFATFVDTYVVARNPFAEDSIYLTLPPNFPATKTPVWMTIQQIAEHNAGAPELVEVQQKHSGLVELPTPQPEAANCVGAHPAYEHII